MTLTCMLAQTTGSATDFFDALFKLGKSSLLLVLFLGFLIWVVLSQRKAIRQQGQAVGQMDEAVVLQRTSVRREEAVLERAHQSLLMQQEQIRLLKKIANEPGEPPPVAPLHTISPAPPVQPRPGSSI